MLDYMHLLQSGLYHLPVPLPADGVLDEDDQWAQATPHSQGAHLLSFIPPPPPTHTQGQHPDPLRPTSPHLSNFTLLSPFLSKIEVRVSLNETMATTWLPPLEDNHNNSLTKDASPAPHITE